MSERLRDVQTRVHSVQQLSAVITAMRGIAAARSREAQASLEGIRAYAGVVATAIGRALALQPVSRTEPPASAHGAHAVVALCAEQGFAGVFNERVLDAAMRAAGDSGQPTLYLIVGNRGASLAEERGLSIDWSGAMVARVAQAPELANRVVEALYQRMATRHVARVTVVYAIPGPTTPLDIVQRRLVPFDFNRFAPKPSAIQPLTTLAPSQLLAKLVEEYVFAELCEAPHGASDYLAIARRFGSVFIDRIPRMRPEKHNEAKRFVTLIDALYESRTKLICSAETEPGALYSAGDGAFEFQRTASRLAEMQTADYLGAEHSAPFRTSENEPARPKGGEFFPQT